MISFRPVSLFNQFIAVMLLTLKQYDPCPCTTCKKQTNLFLFQRFFHAKVPIQVSISSLRAIYVAPQSLGHKTKETVCFKKSLSILWTRKYHISVIKVLPQSSVLIHIKNDNYYSSNYFISYQQSLPNSIAVSTASYIPNNAVRCLPIKVCSISNLFPTSNTFCSFFKVTLMLKNFELIINYKNSNCQVDNFYLFSITLNLNFLNSQAAIKISGTVLRFFLLE